MTLRVKVKSVLQDGPATTSEVACSIAQPSRIVATLLGRMSRDGSVRRHHFVIHEQETSLWMLPEHDTSRQEGKTP